LRTIDKGRLEHGTPVRWVATGEHVQLHVTRRSARGEPGRRRCATRHAGQRAGDATRRANVVRCQLARLSGSEKSRRWSAR
jgi:hypothetical protein